MNIKYGLGFILVLAIILAGSSFFFHDRSELESLDTPGLPADEPLASGSKTQPEESESIALDRGINEQTMDGELNTIVTEDVAEEPESNLEIVFMTLTQEMAKRGYAQELSECIESQFRENHGVENPKDLDTMLHVCEGRFKVESQQRQQIREVVLQSIAKAQHKTPELDKSNNH